MIAFRMKIGGVAALLPAALLLSSVLSAAGTEDASIDRLLKKLPPPEKFVRPRDAALSDPVANKTLEALNAQNFGRALDLSRQFSRSHRDSPIAHGLHGWVAFTMRQFGEATSEFRTSVKLQNDYSFGYFGLGLTEASQNHYASALQNFQQLARLEPKAEVAWVGSSECAERLGRRQDSLTYARHATVLAPNSAAAWLQLARAQDAVGDKLAAQRAFSRARQLGAKKTSSSHRR